MSSVSITPVHPALSNTGALVGGGSNLATIWTDTSLASYVAYDQLEATTADLTNPSIPSGSAITHLILYARASGIGAGAVMSSQLATGSHSNTEFTVFNTGSAPLTAVNVWDVSGLGLVDADIDALTMSVGNFTSTATPDLYVYEASVLVVYYVKPTLTVDSPTGTLTASNILTVDWTPTFDGAFTLGGYKLKVFTDAVYLAGGFDPETATTTLSQSFLGESTPTTSHTFTNNPLANDTYRAYVKVTDGRVSSGALRYSDWAYAEFTINVTPPGDPTITATADPTLARVALVTHDTAGATVVSYEIQREGPADTWTPVRTADGDLDGTDLSLYDYEAPIGEAVTYRARALSVDGIASGWTESTPVTLSITNWWLKHPYDPSLNISLAMRSNPGASRAMRQDAKQPLGRSDVVITSDTPGPWSGEIQVKCVSTAERDALEAILDPADVLLLQGPADQRDHDRWVSISAQSRDNIVAQWYINTWETLPWTEVARPSGDLD